MARLFKWISLLFSGAALSLIAAVSYLIATPAGTGTLARLAAPYLPAELSFGDVGGTLLDEVSISQLEWQTDAARARVEQTNIQIRLAALLQREIYLTSVRLRGVDIDVESGSDDTLDAQDPLAGPFVVELPVAIIVEDLRVDRARVRVDETDRLIDSVSAAAALRGSQLVIDRLALAAEWLTAGLNGRAQLAPPYDGDIVVDYSLRGDDGLVVAGDMRLHGDRSAYSLEHDLTSPYSILTRGQLVWQDELSFDVVNRWTNLVLALGDEAELASRSGALRIEGNTAGVVYVLEADADLPDVGKVDIRADGTADPAELRVTRAAIVSGEQRWDIGGTAIFDVATGAVRFQNTSLASGENRLSANGSAGDVLNLQLRIAAPRLEALYPGLRGALNGNIKLSGTRASPQVAGTLAGRRLAYADWSVESLDAQLEQTGKVTQRVRIDATQIKQGDNAIDSLSVSARGDRDAHDAELDIQRGDATMNLRLTGELLPGEWRGQLRSVDVALSPSERWTSDVPADFQVSTAYQRVDELCLSGGNARRLCAQLDRDATSGKMSLAATLEAFPLDRLVELALPQLDAAGTLSGQLSLALLDGNYDGRFEAAVDSLVLSLADESAASENGSAEDLESVTLSIAADGQIQSNRLQAQGALELGDDGTSQFSLSLADVRTASSAIQARAEFSLRDVSAISLFTPGARVEGGAIEGELTVDGSAVAPLFGGSVRLNDAAVSIPAAGARFSELQLELAPAAPGTLALTGSAVAGGGRVSLRGATKMDAGAGWPTTIELEGEDVEIVRTPDWTVYVSPDLRVDLDTTSARVRGTVVVPRAKAVLDKIPESAEAPSSDTVIYRADNVQVDKGYGYDVELDVVLGENVELEGFGLGTWLTGQLRLKGTDSRAFRGTGELRLVNGRFEAYGQSLSIERGRLGFTGALDNPLLDFRAVRTIDDVKVGITMAGSANRPVSGLFSDPAMTEASALSYLITGRPLEQSTADESGQLANAAIGLGLAQAGGVIDEITRTVGLDELSYKGGSDDGQVLAGKQIGKDLYLRYAFGVFDNVGSLLVRYRLNKRLVVVSESGEEQSLDLFYTVTGE